MFQKRYRLKWLIMLTLMYSTAMMWHWKIGFTYFTQLSNLYVGFVVCTQLMTRRPLPLLKYTATVSICVTFLIYLLVLAPLMSSSLIDAYAQDHCASLFLHLITPLLTVADFILYDAPERRWRRSDALWCTIPPLIWFALILLLGANGFRWRQGMAAPYMFLNYEAPAGWFGWRPDTIGMTSPGIGVFYVILLMTLLFIGIGLGLIQAAKKQRRD